MFRKWITLTDFAFCQNRFCFQQPLFAVCDSYSPSEKSPEKACGSLPALVEDFRADTPAAISAVILPDGLCEIPLTELGIIERSRNSDTTRGVSVAINRPPENLFGCRPENLSLKNYRRQVIFFWWATNTRPESLRNVLEILVPSRRR